MSLSPLEAYEAVREFAGDYGEWPLRLAMHAAVAQSFRPEFLHLLKLNYLHRVADEPAVESDVLQAAFCREIGAGYYQFDAQVRALLLENLQREYESESGGDRRQRLRSVAQFLLAYAGGQERHPDATHDRLLRGYIEVHRWIGLSLLDPDDAAQQLAAALNQVGLDASDAAARVRVGGLVNLLAVPLLRYPQLADYALGVQALERGDLERAETLLSGLGDRELQVGAVKLRAASELLSGWGVGRKVAAAAIGRDLKAGDVWTNPKDGLRYVWIPPGKFMMGCSPGDSDAWDDEKPAHEVTITRGFWLGRTPVTVAAYNRYAKATSQELKKGKPEEPVVEVNWHEAVKYAEWAGMRLPTEAEWEYAARAGTTGSRYGKLDEIAWYDKNSGNKIHPVGQKLPNAWGLYDMLGNVYEWVGDWWDEKWYEQKESLDPKGPATGASRVLRGGSWVLGSRIVRASNRIGNGPVLRYSIFGFRCAGELR